MSAGGAVFFWVEEFGEARVFLQKSEILVVAGVIAIFASKVDSDLEIFEGGIGFAGQAVQSGERVMDVVGLWRGFACFVEAFAGVIPAADVHHGDAALVMIFGSARGVLGSRLHALLGNFDMHAGAVDELFAGALKNFFQLLLGTRELLLVKKRESFIVELELGLDARVNQFDTPTLRRVGRR